MQTRISLEAVVYLNECHLFSSDDNCWLVNLLPFFFPNHFITSVAGRLMFEIIRPQQNQTRRFNAMSLLKANYASDLQQGTFGNPGKPTLSRGPRESKTSSPDSPSGSHQVVSWECHLACWCPSRSPFEAHDLSNPLGDLANAYINPCADVEESQGLTQSIRGST